MSPRDLGNHICSKCKVMKVLSDFSRDHRSTNGRMSACKLCEAERKRGRKSLRSEIVITVTEKRCYSCKTLKPSNDFRRDNDNADLLNSYCKRCESTKKAVRNRRMLATNPTYKSHLSFRRLIRNFRTSSATDDEIDSHRLVSRETYCLWLDYQTKVKSVVGPIDIDHTFPDSKFDLSNPFERLIGTNIVNLSPMNASENRSKGAKIMPELILNQITVANDFLLETDLSDDEKLKFAYLVDTYEAFANFKLANVLKELDILK